MTSTNSPTARGAAWVLVAAGLACTSTAHAQQAGPPPQPEAMGAAMAAAAPTLDGLAFDGRIRATGWRGLFSVAGTLSFADGQLLWTARGTTDAAPYTLSRDSHGLRFRAQHEIERGEVVAWTGVVDGRMLRGAEAAWTRRSGDAVHDLLLPPEVTLRFTADGRAPAPAAPSIGQATAVVVPVVHGAAPAAPAKKGADVPPAGRFPDIVDARVRAAGGGVFDFDVTVSSPYDTPARYADGFRVLTPEGTELGVRKLWHDHQHEQPFTRDLHGVRVPPEVRRVVIQGRDQRHGWGGRTLEVALPGR